VTTLHDFGGVLGQPLDTFLGLPQFHGHGSWLMCELALIPLLHLTLFHQFLGYKFTTSTSASHMHECLLSNLGGMFKGDVIT
jgi:hypothetical protein